MTWVVDASVAVKWFVRETLHDRALALLDHGQSLAAPDLIIAEVTNIAWKKTIRSEISRQHARIITRAICQYVPALHPSADLAERALEISLVLNHSVYDCLYLACAETVNGILTTADQGLLRSVQGSAFESMIRSLEDLGVTDDGG